MKIQPTVLLVEDNVISAKIYKNHLSNEPISVTHLETGNATLTYLNEKIPDVILLDLGLPDMNGIDILKFIYEQKLKCFVIILTAEKAVDIVVKAMQYGAFDFIEKPCEPNRLIVTVRNALRQCNLLQQIEFQEEYIKQQHYYGFIGISKSMQTVYQTIDSVATSKAPILIIGETGTGKELCAEAIYKESKRANKPFVVCNCAAIPEKLIESHLFGHVKGAFTGAISEQKGLVFEANGGTLFLDEIGELPFAMQSSLLRFVQTKTFSKIGSHKVEQVDIRLICATNRDLLVEVKAGRFREDLYHRLNTIEIELPALRQRGQDILRLAKFFLHQFTKEEQKGFHEFSPEAEKMLLGYKWSGNVRELQNTIHNSVVLNKGEVITAEMITIRNNESVDNDITLAITGSTITSSGVVTINKFCSFEEIEQEVIVKTVEYCDGNVVKAAKLLKISKSYIYKLKKQWQSNK